MKQRKIAISLAVVGAIAAPFVFKTYKMLEEMPLSDTWIPMTAEIKANVESMLERTHNCQDYADRGARAALEGCRYEQKALKEGGGYGPRPSVVLYTILNVGVSVLAFGAVYGLTFLLPALTRRYWRWLNT